MPRPPHCVKRRCSDRSWLGLALAPPLPFSDKVLGRPELLEEGSSLPAKICKPLLAARSLRSFMFLAVKEASRRPSSGSLPPRQVGRWPTLPTTRYRLRPQGRYRQKPMRHALLARPRAPPHLPEPARRPMVLAVFEVLIIPVLLAGLGGLSKQV